MQNPRECALDVLIKVDKKEELSHIAISNVLEKYQFSEKRDRAFFTRLVEGTLVHTLPEECLRSLRSRLRFLDGSF